MPAPLQQQNLTQTTPLVAEGGHLTHVNTPAYSSGLGSLFQVPQSLQGDVVYPQRGSARTYVVEPYSLAPHSAGAVPPQLNGRFARRAGSPHYDQLAPVSNRTPLHVPGGTLPTTAQLEEYYRNGGGAVARPQDTANFVTRDELSSIVAEAVREALKVAAVPQQQPQVQQPQTPVPPPYARTLSVEDVASATYSSTDGRVYQRPRVVSFDPENTVVMFRWGSVQDVDFDQSVLLTIGGVQYSASLVPGTYMYETNGGAAVVAQYAIEL